MVNLGRMMALTASTIASFALQGCVTAVGGVAAVDVDTSSQEAVPPSEGLQMAAPAPLGSPEMSATEAAGLEELIDNTVVPAASTLFTAALPTGELEAPDEPVIKLTAMTSTIDAVIPSKEWSEGEAVAIIAARQNTEELVAPAINDEAQDFAAEFSIDAPGEITGLGFDVGVVPRIAYSEAGITTRRSFGGELRIGQDFDKRGSDDVPHSWYVFAGADGEALTFEPNSEDGLGFDSTNMALRDQVTVGDVQAGVSVQKGPGQLSLSYIRREVEYNERGIKGMSRNEDFAGVSFTLRK